MDYFIVRDGKYVILTEAVIEGECKLSVVICSVDGIQLHIIKSIIHPSHVPLEIESETSHIHGFGNTRPGSGFFRYHEHIRIPCKYRRIEFLKELHSFVVFYAAILVGTIFLPVIIKIEHGSNCIDSESVHMEFLYPVHCIGYKERSYLSFGIVKYPCTP